MDAAVGPNGRAAAGEPRQGFSPPWRFAGVFLGCFVAVLASDALTDPLDKWLPKMQGTLQEPSPVPAPCSYAWLPLCKGVKD